MSDTEARRQQILDAWEKAWDHGDLSGFESLLSPDYRRITATNPDGESREQFLAVISTTRESFPDLTTQVEDIVIEGDSAAIRWSSGGTHQRGLMGVPPTNRRVNVSGATFAHFENGLIVREHVTWDPRALLSALGIISVGQD